MIEEAFPHVRATTSLDEILADEEVKGVFVSVSPEAHFSIASKVLENGKSSIDSVYACGDVTFKRVYQLITASNDGVMVASDIIDKCLGVEF